MPWIKFSERKPENCCELITRCIPWDKKGDAFENWRIWTNDLTRIMPNMTHWWDGEFNFDNAVKEWMNESKK